MTDSGDHGNLGLINSVGNLFIVKGPQVFNRAAASTHNQQVCQLVIIGIADSSSDFIRCFRPLYSYRKQTNLRQRIPFSQNAEHIMYRGSSRAGNNTDHTGILRNRFFVRRVKQSLGRQFGLQLLKSRIKITDAVKNQAAAVKLICAVSGIN